MGTPSNQSNGPISQELYSQGSGTASSDPFITVFFTRDPTVNDIQYPIKKRWINTATITEWILENFVSISGITTAHWININSATPTLLTLTGNTGGAVPPNAGNINVVGDGTTITIAGNPGTNTLTASLIGGSTLLQTLTVDHADAPGVNPVTPTAGATITITGAAVAAQNIPVRTETNILHQIRIENQLTSTTTSLGKSITNAGISSFDSAVFSVDAATGFVSLAGSGFVQTLTGDDGVAVTPLAGTINLHGSVVTNATNAKAVFVKANGLHEDDVQIQVGAAIAATDITKVGLAAFNSAQFTVDANGFVTITGGAGPIEKFAMQTGTTPVVADGSGTVIVNGATVVAGTNPVRSHGTGANTYQIEVQRSQAIASTDSTKIGLSNFDSATFTVDANGFVQMLHTPITKVVRQVFTSNGTYTPTTGMLYCDIEVVGGGGGGGGCQASGGGTAGGGAGGNGGGYAKGIFSAATIGVSQAVTIGTAGAGGAAGANPGSTGGTTSVGALISASGGGGGGGSGVAGSITLAANPSATTGTGTGGNFQVSGGIGQVGFVWIVAGNGTSIGGSGGSSPYGQGGSQTSTGAGIPALVGFGGGGGGGSSQQGTSGAQPGGNGRAGVVIITEYIFA